MYNDIFIVLNKDLKMIFNKKFGFTLAEVLITLGIIGVVAAMTIPTLMKNTQDLELKSAWKKAYSTIAQASLSVKNDNGGTFAGITCSATYISDCLRDAYLVYLKSIKTCDTYSNVLGPYGPCFHPLTGGQFLYTVKDLSGASSLQVNSYGPFFGGAASGIILQDGQLVLFYYFDSTCASGGEGYTDRCAGITVDVNGFKGPNTIGRDIFAVHVLKDKIVPTGAKTWSNRCTTSTDGIGCSALYLYQ